MIGPLRWALSDASVRLNLFRFYVQYYIVM